MTFLWCHFIIELRPQAEKTTSQEANRDKHVASFISGDEILLRNHGEDDENNA